MRAAIVLSALLVISSSAQQIAPGVRVSRGDTNGVVITRNNRSLAIYGDPGPPPQNVETVLLTHHRRDVLWAAEPLLANGAQAVAPEGEKQRIAETDAFWREHLKARYHDYAARSSKVAARSIAVTRFVKGGDVITWQGLSFQVIDTPGYTEGAVSYLVQHAGKRIAFTGDLILSGGRIFDLYSLQAPIPETNTRGYHGYASRGAALLRSLAVLKAWKPDVIVPVRGEVITQPAATIEALTRKLRELYRLHFETDALRWYWGDDHLRSRARLVLGDQPIQWMEMAETAELPSWVLAADNSRLIVSRDGAGFLIDCGSAKRFDQLAAWQRDRKFAKLEGLYISHYHDDHTDFAQEASARFDVPVHAAPELSDILANPPAYALPCLTTNPIRRLEPMREGVPRRWHEFTLTSFYFPGQTLYHDALLVTRDGGESVFFVGDSFTPSGMDDYCLQNRNFVNLEEGYSYCLRKLRALPRGTWLVNQHVPPMWRFTAAQLDRMESTRAARIPAMRDLFPWDDPDYAVDDSWARFYPYEQRTRADGTLELSAVIRNHSPRARAFKITPEAPAGWEVTPRSADVNIAPRKEGTARFQVRTSGSTAAPAIVTADIETRDQRLHRWIEALITRTGN
jgi:glyoxylase-like metal-dependent hydrolase (beta-lactamase superfamily II)